MENSVSKEIATTDVTRWLDTKKISASKREANKTVIEQLVGYVEEGVLVLQEDNTFVHNLKFPIEADRVTDKLVYKSRVNVDEVGAGLKGATTGAEIIKAYISLLTGQVKGVIGKLDSEDLQVAQSITSFFL